MKGIEGEFHGVKGYDNRQTLNLWMEARVSVKFLDVNVERDEE